MYKTEKQRRTEGRPSRYTAPELDRACAEYFRMCDGEGQKPTRAGLLLFLGLTEQAWGKMEEGAPGYRRHPAICQKAILEIRDRLEQRTDSAALFLLKQGVYGGYSDRPAAGGGGEVTIRVTFGGDGEGEE
mgnify:FL=1